MTDATKTRAFEGHKRGGTESQPTARRHLGGPDFCLNVARSRLRPVLDIQAGDRLKVGVFRDHRAIAERQGDGGNLKVDLWNDSATPAKVCVQPPVFARRLFVEDPASDSGHGTREVGSIAFGGAAEFDAAPQLANDGSPDADAIAAPQCLGNSPIHGVSTVDPIRDDA